MNDTSTKVTSADFPDEAATHYDQFFGPLYFEPYAIEVANRIAPAPVSIVLEIAAGTGRVTRHIRESIPPSAQLIASDINEDMLSIAKKKLSHLDIGVLVSLDQKDNGSIYSNGWRNIETPLKSWWWTSNLSGYPYNAGYTRDSKDSADNYNPNALTKISEVAASYSQTTWDNAYSHTGPNATNNVFRWIVDTSECAGGGEKRIFTEDEIITPTEVKEMSITPNPAMHALNIAWMGEGGNAQLLIIDMLGRILYLKQLPSAKGSNVYQLNTSALANGEYLLKLSIGKKVFTKIFLKR
jgi:SAM-dependent methyltransferase